MDFLEQGVRRSRRAERIPYRGLSPKLAESRDPRAPDFLPWR
jgi:hypothetical protein